MYEADGQLIFSASDLTGFLACQHLTQLDLLVAEGQLPQPHRHDPLLEIISRLGDEHERGYLDQLRSQCLEVVEIAHPEATIGPPKSPQSDPRYHGVGRGCHLSGHVLVLNGHYT